MEEKPNYFAVIPADVRYDENLKLGEKMMYGEITSLTQKTGECWASNSYFATLYKVTPQAISKWIKALEKQKYITIEYEKEGKSITKRIIKLVSTDIDRVSTPVERGINTSLEGYQHRIKENNTSINNTSINNKRKYIKESFEELWKLYPNKKGKTGAYKKYEKLINNGTSIETIKDGIQRYKDYIEAEHIKPQYIKYGSTFFNQESWKDDFTITRKPTTKDLADKIDFMNFLKED